MTLNATYRSEDFNAQNLQKTAGVVIAAGNEVIYGADSDKFTLSNSAFLGIGIATEAAISGSTARQDIVQYGSGGTIMVIQDGTAVRGATAVSKGDGKLMARPAGGTASTTLAAVPVERGIFQETSAVDGALVAMKFF